jgi:hypothetical protein
MIQARTGTWSILAPIKNNRCPRRTEKERPTLVEKKERCPEINWTYEHQCELIAEHDGWHAFPYRDGTDDVCRWPGPSLP